MNDLENNYLFNKLQEAARDTLRWEGIKERDAELAALQERVKTLEGALEHVLEHPEIIHCKCGRRAAEVLKHG